MKKYVAFLIIAFLSLSCSFNISCMDPGASRYGTVDERTLKNLPHLSTQNQYEMLKDKFRSFISTTSNKGMIEILNPILKLFNPKKAYKDDQIINNFKSIANIAANLLDEKHEEKGYMKILDTLEFPAVKSKLIDCIKFIKESLKNLPIPLKIEDDLGINLLEFVAIKPILSIDQVFSENLLETIIKNESNLKHKDNFLLTALHKSILVSNINLTKQLIEKDPTLLDEQGFFNITPNQLLFAMTPESEIIQKNKLGFSPPTNNLMKKLFLMLGHYQGNQTIVKAIVDEDKSFQNNRAFALALISHLMNRKNQDQRERTSTFISWYSTKYDWIPKDSYASKLMFLLSIGYDMNKIDSEQNLLTTILDKHSRMAKDYILGINPLLFSFFTTNQAIVKLFISKGANVDDLLIKADYSLEDLIKECFELIGLSSSNPIRILLEQLITQNKGVIISTIIENIDDDKKISEEEKKELLQKNLSSIKVNDLFPYILEVNKRELKTMNFRQFIVLRLNNFTENQTLYKIYKRMQQVLPPAPSVSKDLAPLKNVIKSLNEKLLQLSGQLTLVAK